MKELLRHLTNAPVAVALAFLLVGAPAAPVAKMMPSCGSAMALGCAFTHWGCDADGDGIRMNSAEDLIATGVYDNSSRDSEDSTLTVRWDDDDDGHLTTDAQDMCQLAEALENLAKAGAVVAVVSMILGASAIPAYGVSVVAGLAAAEIKEAYDCPS